jgi:hypothetical protein
MDLPGRCARIERILEGPSEGVWRCGVKILAQLRCARGVQPEHAAQHGCDGAGVHERGERCDAEQHGPVAPPGQEATAIDEDAVDELGMTADERVGHRAAEREPHYMRSAPGGLAFDESGHAVRGVRE